MKFYDYFSSDRLDMTIAKVSDAIFFLELFNTPSWLKYIGDRQVHSVEDAEKMIESRMVAQYQRLGFGNYVLRLKGSDIPIGVCGLYDRPNFEGIDLGYAILPAYEGNGYASEAAITLFRAAKEVIGLKDIKAFTVVDHPISQKILRKLGMEPIKRFYLEGSADELILFGKVE
jgi:RimJ/RimL family protein N-acetyltransferase